MKTRFLSMLLFAGLTIFFYSCDPDDDDGNCRVISGARETRVLNLPSVDGILLEIPARLTVRQGSPQQITLTGPSDLLDLLNNRISSNTWIVETSVCYRDGDDLTIDATLEEVEFLGISGAADIESDSTLTGDDLDLSISGAGNMNIDANVDDIEVSVSGVGGITLQGATQQLEYSLSGEGNLSAFDLIAREVFIRISGSGNADVTATDLLDIRISGVGNVRYKGRPSINQSISGVGSVIDAN